MNAPETAVVMAEGNTVVNASELRHVIRSARMMDKGFSIELYYKNIRDPLTILFGDGPYAKKSRDRTFDEILVKMEAASHFH